ncbi:NAD(P)/FAD-dependent oxidoreductase [Companilactobacillus allii]|uniref:Glutathione reductase n=1 Tax=Companilactobacillus allii TaxID=1847728 RepID=A0A1P8PZX7_9LACO|nr:NAD(P)/FAD-dependent oxidoreductase [Companilactobacillus allii]APX71155.1 glutathione reductase [Companilactobacillus allii]USQ68236.1 NAD(P)/FAD-dependent oxidoreductase [Companilactobacillus allii]
MTNKYDYDVLYIGAGHGTFDGAIPLAKTGCKVAVVESGLIGGTCPNKGCNAKITLDQPVKISREIENSNELEGNIQINWEKSLKHKQDLIDQLPPMISGLMKSVGIDIVKGHGIFKDQHTVVVDGNVTVTADKIVVSTGLRPNRLDIPGDDLAHDSENFMNLKSLPKNIVIMGAGYIGMEFATIANAAGSKVTVLMHNEMALREFHQPFVQKVVDDLKKRGVTFVENAKITSLEESGADIIVTCDGQKIQTDWVLDATGRIPNIEKIGLEKIGVKCNKHGIIVNDHLQTNVDNVYASGDVIDKIQPRLTPTAVFESTYLMKLFSGVTTGPIVYPVIPTVTFTSPRIAQAGVTVEEGVQKGYKIVDSDLTGDWYYQVDNEPIAESKFIYDKDNKLVGVTEVSDKADDVINTLLPIIELKLDSEQLGRIVSLFPSISSDVMGRI